MFTIMELPTKSHFEAVLRALESPPKRSSRSSSQIAHRMSGEAAYSDTASFRLN